jgi:hypothetical protein
VWCDKTNVSNKGKEKNKKFDNEFVKKLHFEKIDIIEGKNRNEQEINPRPCEVKVC